MNKNNESSYQVVKHTETFQMQTTRDRRHRGYYWVGLRGLPAKVETRIPTRSPSVSNRFSLERCCNALVFAGICCLSLAYLVWLFQSASVGAENLKMINTLNPVSLGEVANLLQ